MSAAARAAQAKGPRKPFASAGTAAADAPARRPAVFPQIAPVEYARTNVGPAILVKIFTGRRNVFHMGGGDTRLAEAVGSIGRDRQEHY